MSTVGFNHEKRADGKDEWLTPPYIVEALGEFDLDPAAPVVRPWETAKRYHTQLDDGLFHDWSGRVWCNPPYGPKVGLWLDKLAKHGNGIALVFARTETNWYHKHVWPKAHSIFFFRNRLNFHHVDGTRGGRSGASSCLIAYGEDNMIAIAKAHSEGKIDGFHLPLIRIDR